MTEAQLTKRILLALRHMGAFAHKIHGGTYQSRGLPDIIGCYNGAFFGLEVKLPGKEQTLTLLQAKKLQDIKDAGGIAAMVTSVNEAIKVVKRGYKRQESVKGTFN